MSTMFDDKLEPLAVQMAQIEPGMKVREVAEISDAISAKRQADALERIATAIEVGNGLSMILHDGELDGRQNGFVENVCSAIAARVG